MGVRAALTEIRPDLFEQVCAGEEPILPNDSRHSIDKAWYDFHAVFRGKGPPLSLAIAGDFLHPQCHYRLEEVCAGNHDYYMAIASRRLVCEIADALTGLTTSDYKLWKIESAGDQYNCGENFFPGLKAAYVDAAAREYALMIVIC